MGCGVESCFFMSELCNYVSLTLLKAKVSVTEIYKSVNSCVGLPSKKEAN